MVSDLAFFEKKKKKKKKKTFFFFLILRLKPPNQKIKKALQRQRRLGLATWYASFIDTAAGGIATSDRKT